MNQSGKPTNDSDLGATQPISAGCASLIDRLIRSRLITSEQIDECRKFLPATAATGDAATGGAAVLQEFIRTGLITRWQAEMLLAGRTEFLLGRYKLLQELGQGGMGTVYTAMHVTLQRTVALKVLASKALKNPAAVARFHREIQAIAALDHPNIVAAFDADCVDNTHFLVMELVAGEDLDRLAKRVGRLPIGAACEFVRQAAAGLQHAHERGLAHRDIKPSNLLLASTTEGQPIVKVLDLGLARFAAPGDDGGGLTQTGEVMGTPDYIAPEQAQSSKTADIRSDIFSLGCTLFRLLTGTIPYPGETLMEKLMARVMREAPAASSLRPEIPPALDAVVARMLARDPAARHQTPADVAGALVPFAVLAEGVQFVAATAQAAAARAPGEQRALPAGTRRFRDQLSTQVTAGDAARPPGLPTAEPLRKRGTLKQPAATTRRHWRVPLMTATIMLAICVVVALATAWREANMTTLIVDWPESERNGGNVQVDGVRLALPATGELQFKRSGGRRSLRLSRDGYESVEQTWDLPSGGVATFTPEWRPTATTARNLEATELTRRVAEITSADPERSETVKLRGDLTRFAREHVASPESPAIAKLMSRLPWPVDSLRREDIPAQELRLAGLGSPDGAPAELVAILGSGRLKTWGSVRGLSYAPDGKTLLVIGDMHSMSWDLKTGEPKHFFDKVSFTAVSAARRLGATCRDENDTIRIWNLDTGKQELELDDPLLPISPLVFSPDGRYLAGGTTDGRIVAWNLNSPEPAAVVWNEPDPLVKESNVGDTPVDRRVQALAYSPDGRLLAWKRASEPITVWQVEQKKALLSLHFSDPSLKSLVFNPDGSLLAVAVSKRVNGRIRIWDTLSGDDVGTLGTYPPPPKPEEEFSPIGGIAFSPNGQTLAAATAGWDVTVNVYAWNVADRAIQLQHGLCDEVGTAIAFAPDGKTVTIGTNMGHAVSWNLATGERLPSTVPGHESSAQCAAVARDGATVATSSADGTTILWNLATGLPRHELPRQVGEVRCVEFSADIRSLATFGHWAGLQHWDADTGAHLHKYEGVAGGNFLGSSADGRRLMAANAGGATLWDVAAKRQIYSVNVNELRAAAISPDGKTLALGVRKAKPTSPNGVIDEIQIWDVATNQLKESHSTSDPLTSAEFSPNGKQVLFNTNSAQILDLDRHRVRIGGDVWASFATYDPQGQRFAALNGNTITIADAESGYPERTIRFPPGHFANHVTFTPDGRHLISANGNGTAYVLRLKPWPLPAQPAAQPIRQ